MISTHALSEFTLHHHLNRLGKNNLHSIQDFMCASEPDAKKYKRVCEDFPHKEYSRSEERRVFFMQLA